MDKYPITITPTINPHYLPPHPTFLPLSILPISFSPLFLYSHHLSFHSLLPCISLNLSSLSPHHLGLFALSRPTHGLTTALIHQAHIRPPPQQSPHISGPRPSYIRPLSPYLNTSSNTRPFVHPAQNSLNFLCTLTT